MSERGVFAVDRGVFEHDMFAPEPFTEREAWIWMIGAAAWQPKRVRVGRKIYDVARGQLVFSERFLAVKWRWSKSRVHRFLKRLEIEAMASHQTDREATHITICNYDNYQFGRTTGEPQSEPQTEPLADHPRTKEEEGKELKKEEKKDTSSLRSDARARSRGTRLPPDWRPDDAGRTFAIDLIGNQRSHLELQKFRDYWHARAGPGGVKLDWEATWRNWIRKAAETKAQGNGKRTVQDAADDLVERVRGLGDPLQHRIGGPAGAADVRLLPPGRRE